MTLQEILGKLSSAFAEAENVGNSFNEEQFFRKPGEGKWSAAEHVQHLFTSVKPLVGLFGKPELMLQFGKRSRPGMSYEELYVLYNEKLNSLAIKGIVNNVEGLSPTRDEQMQNLHGIHTKFLERASTLSEEILDDYQIPHPLLGLLTVKEFLYFTHFHTLHHTKTMVGLR